MTSSSRVSRGGVLAIGLALGLSPLGAGAGGQGRVLFESGGPVLTLPGAGGPQRYFRVSERRPLRFRALGPGRVALTLRKNIDPADRSTREIAVVTVTTDRTTTRTYRVPSRAGAARFREAGAPIPSVPFLVAIPIPEGTHEVEVALLSSLVGDVSVAPTLERPDGLREPLAPPATGASPPPSLSPTPSASAEPPLRPFPRRAMRPTGEETMGVGARLGAAFLSGLLAPGATVELRSRFPEPVAFLWAQVEAGYYAYQGSDNRTEPVAGLRYSDSWRMQVVPLAADLVVEIPWIPPWSLFVGAGGGYYLATYGYRYSVSPQERVVAASTAGYQALGGVEFRLGGGSLLAEGRWMGADLPSSDALSAGGVGGAQVSLGYRYRF